MSLRITASGSSADSEDPALLTSSSRSSGGIFASLRSVSSSIRSVDIKTPKGGESRKGNKRRSKRESGGIYVPSERSLRKSVVSDDAEAKDTTDVGKKEETAMNAPDPAGDGVGKKEVTEVEVAEDGDTETVDTVEADEGSNAESDDGGREDTVTGQVAEDGECETTNVGGDCVTTVDDAEEEQDDVQCVSSKSFESAKSEDVTTISTVSIEDKENEMAVEDTENGPRGVKCENAQSGSGQGECCGDGGLGRWLQSRLGPRKVEWANSSNNNNDDGFVLKELEQP